MAQELAASNTRSLSSFVKLSLGDCLITWIVFDFEMNERSNQSLVKELSHCCNSLHLACKSSKCYFIISLQKVSEDQYLKFSIIFWCFFNQLDNWFIFLSIIVNWLCINYGFPKYLIPRGYTLKWLSSNTNRIQLWTMDEPLGPIIAFLNSSLF